MSTTKKPTAVAVKPNTLGAYKSSKYAAEIVLAPAKVGKTVSLIGNALGVMPWQEYGGIVDKPENLHVITFDAVTCEGALEFLMTECGAPEGIKNVHVENLEQAARKAFAGGAYDSTFPNKVYDAVRKCQDLSARGGVHMILFCSLTMCAKAWLRSLSGPALTNRSDGTMQRSPMDQNKWGLFAMQMTELQFQVQDQDKYHVIWETHWAEKTSEKKKDNEGNPKVYDTIQVMGSTKEQFPAQCARPYMLTRKKGSWKAGSKVGLVEFDTQPDLDFGESMMAGRKVVGVLEPKENDLTVMFNKLGLEIGGWGT